MIMIKKTANEPINHLLFPACITIISMFKVIKRAKILLFF